MQRSDAFYWVLFNSISTISFLQFKSLVEFFENDLEKAFHATEDNLKQISHMTASLMDRILNLKKDNNLQWIEKELNTIEQEKIQLICYLDEEYPFLLKQIFNPPPLLYVKGHIPKTKYFLGVVGARQASFYGLDITKHVCEELASYDVTIVSGGARGIDRAAHETVLKNKGFTIAILGQGFKVIYPQSHRKLYEEISESGALISEFPLYTPPLPYQFPRRNRIISGLSHGVCVVEASEKSGALITARYALEQGREVFAIPGNVGVKGSEGTLKLIQEGAKVVTGAIDILEEFKITKMKDLTFEQNLMHALSKEEEKILHLLDQGKNFQELLNQSHFEASFLSDLLLSCELKGWISSQEHRYYRRIS